MRPLLLTVLMTTLAACGASTPVSETKTSLKPHTPVHVQPGSFDLYDTPHYLPQGTCDIFRHLALYVDRSESFASLESGVNGQCEIFIAPRIRTYRLTISPAGCGSLLYTAKNSDGQALLEITDHRTRLCEDLQPNLIKVKETIDGETNTYFSLSNL